MIINSFKGKYDFLSNFYLVDIEFENILYPSVEHAYQAAKTYNYSDKVEISKLPTAAQAKKYGRRLKIKGNWDEVKVEIMRELVYLKFSENIQLKKKLLETGDCELIEGNWWHDHFWGVFEGIGENWLGKILMETREKLKEVKDNG